MELEKKHIGFALTGSFCTLVAVIPQIEKLVLAGARITPILSTAVSTFNTRFGQAQDLKDTLFQITKTPPLDTIIGVEPIGPQAWLDLLVIAPCTGNTLAKLALGITDDTVVMAAKAQLRNHRPLVLGISTNDGLGLNAKNLGLLLATENIFFVPFGQDDPEKKKNSLVCEMTLLSHTVQMALDRIQIQPLLRQYS